MAIKQQITSVSGVKTEYHRIAKAELDFTTHTATITVFSYLNAAKRDEEKEHEQMPYESRYILKTEHYITLPDDTDFDLEFAYGWLKENIYTSSEDC